MKVKYKKGILPVNKKTFGKGKGPEVSGNEIAHPLVNVFVVFEHGNKQAVVEISPDQTFDTTKTILGIYDSKSKLLEDYPHIFYKPETNESNESKNESLTNSGRNKITRENGKIVAIDKNGIKTISPE